MPELPLTSGLFGRPRIDLPAVRAVNCFFESTPGGPTKDVRTSRPGFSLHIDIGTGPILRQFQKPGLFNSNLSDGDLFSVSGSELYRTGVDPDPANRLLGSVAYSTAPRFAAAQSFLALVVGGALYVYDGTNLTLVEFFDDGYSLLPPFSSVAVLYNIWVYTVTGSNQFFFSAVGNPSSINAANFSSAQVSPTPIVEVQTLAEELYFFKTDGVEIWDFTGELTAPFAESPGRTYTRGCAAQNSVTLTDNSLFWIGDDFAFYRTGGVPTRLTDTTSYVEDRVKAMGAQVSQITSFTFNLEGHVWYVTNLTPLNETYAYDCQTKQWFIWGSQQPNQMEPGVWLPQTCAGQGQRIFFGSSVDGRVWRAEPDHHSDDGIPIRVVVAGALWMGEDKKRMNNLTLHGVRGIATPQTPLPKAWMRLSDDGGRTWNSWVEGSLGMVGTYRWKVSWHSLGLMQQPGRLIEFAISDSVNVSIEGAAYNTGRR